MSVLLKIVLSALVVGGIGFGIWNHNQEERAKQENASLDASAALSVGSTNDDLDRDIVTIDGQLNAAEQDSNEVDQSFNDESTLK